MDLDKFAELVAQMRSAQKFYFRTRDREALDRAKRLEAEVDHTITAIKNPGLPGIN